MKHATLLGEKIGYSVRRSPDVTIPRVDIDLNGVRVVLPETFEDDAETLLQEKAVQVVRNKKKYDRYREEIPDRKFEAGEKFPFLGKDHEVVLTSEEEEHKAKDGKLILPRDRVEDSTVKEELQQLYKKEARKIIEEILEKHSDLNIDYNRIRLKNQKTRWGSCSPKRNLNFNWRIAMAPKSIIEYVVVHELVHLEEDNHSKKFWAKLSSILPDYKERNDWLKQNAPLLVFSQEDY